MKIKNLQQKLAKTGIVLTLAFGFMILTAASASAQYYPQNNQRQDRRDDRNDRNRNNDLYRVARENGYRDGQNEARRDRRDRDRNNPQKANEYKKATNGYYSRLGNKNAYKDAYRQAFLEGYNSVGNRRGRRNGNRNGY